MFYHVGILKNTDFFMSTIIVEKIVNAFLNKDSQEIIDIVDELISRAEDKGQVNVKKRLTKLIARIPKNYSFSGQNLISKPTSNELFDIVHSKIDLNTVILSDQQRKNINRLINEWKKIESLKKHDVTPNNRAIFYGPPGTGKTKLAFGIAHELNMPLLYVRLDELISSYLGQTGKNIREIFEIANKQNVIVFLDEIDTIAKNRGDKQELGELKRVVTVLLQNIDNMNTSSLLIGATNNESILDKAVWRRFSIRLEFELPEERERKDLFKLYINGFQNNVDFSVVAKLSHGLSGSDIQLICENSKRAIILSDRTKLKTSDVLISVFNFFEMESKKDKFDKKQKYEMCKVLNEDGVYSVPEIAEIAGIPYTTLLDNLKK